MKIEKISDNQIRCTLSKDDLIDRELRLSELAYGSEKAKALFRDMMQQASYEFGFEADDLPLMIEAIPVSPECLVLVVTKVEDPDELDTRFSKFSSSTSDNDDSGSELDDDAYADEILNCFDQLDELLDDEDTDGDDTTSTPHSMSFDSSEEKKEPKTASVSIRTNFTRVYSFASLSEVIDLSKVLVNFYHGENALYKDSHSLMYYLVINKSDHTPEEFNKICNMISEYGKQEKTTYATVNFYNEHYEVIVKANAIQILSVM